MDTLTKVIDFLGCLTSSAKNPPKNVLYGMLFCVYLLPFSTQAKQIDFSVPENWLNSDEFCLQRGLEEINAHYAYAAGYTGKNVRLGILDTAIFTGHPEFSGEGKLTNLVTEGYRSVDDDILGVKKGDYFYYDGTPGRYYTLSEDHGTHVAGIAGAKRDGDSENNYLGMMGVAFDALLIGAEISNPYGAEMSHQEGVYELDGAVYGAAWAGLIKSGARVINNSWLITRGFETNFSKQHAQEQFNEIESLLSGPDGGAYQGMIDAVNNGVLLVFSAGNYSGNEPTATAGLPAFIPEIAAGFLAVVSADYNWFDDGAELSYFSSRCGYTASFCVSAPGEFIYSAGFYPQRDGSVEPYYTLKDGTSMSAPQVSGSAAVLMERFPYMTGEQIATVLKTTANDIGEPGVDDVFGWGMIDLQKAINGPAMFVTNEDLPEAFRIEGAWGDGQFVANLVGRGVRLDPGKAIERVCNENRCDIDIWSNDISGHGGLTKTGSGTLVLSGENTYRGPTLVQTGRLAVEGRIQSAVFVDDGGIISGNGRVGSLNVNSGGVVAPGNSIGTLTIDGDLLLASGAIYQVEVDGNLSDRVISDGKITLSGANLDVDFINLINLQSVLSQLPSFPLEIMRATEGIEGIFTQVTSNMDTLFLGTLADYQADSVNLTFGRNSRVFSDTTRGRNARRAAEAAHRLKDNEQVPTLFTEANQRVITDNALYNNLLLLSSLDQASSVFEQLSGQIHSDVLTSQINESRYLRDSVVEHLRQARGLGEYSEIKTQDSVWGRLITGWEHAAGNNDATSYNRSTYGFLFGFDSDTLVDWQLGLTMGYTRTSLNGGYHSSSKADNYRVGIYAGRQFGQFALRAGADYAWHRFDTSRAVNFGLFSEQLKAKYHGSTQQLFTDLGYLIQRNQLTFEPFINLSYVNASGNGFSETGGDAALVSTKNSHDVLLSTLGLRLNHSLALGQSTLRLQGELGWQHDYSNQDRERQVRYNNTPSTFLTTSVPASRDSAVIKLMGEASPNDNLTISLGYNAVLSQKNQDNSVNANLKWRF